MKSAYYALAMVGVFTARPAWSLENATNSAAGADIVRPELQIGLQIQELHGFTQIANAADFVGLQLTPRIALSPSVSVGITGSLAIYAVGQSRDDLGPNGSAPPAFPFGDHAVWRISAEGRWHPFALAIDPWVGVEAGLAAARDSVGNSAVTQHAPVAGIVVGVDLPLGKRVSLGAELRALWIGFARSGPPLGDSVPSNMQADGLTGAAYGPSLWIVSGIGTTLRVSL